MSRPLAYFITFTTYGTWLQGRDPGSVDRDRNVPGTPFLPPDADLEAAERRALRHDPYLLDEARRVVVLRTIQEVAKHRGWTLWAAHVRSNHVHVVVTAADKPEKAMSDLKAWASRRLREAFGEEADRDRWTRHGSTRWLNSEESLDAAIAYVLDRQGERMASFDGRLAPNAAATAGRPGAVADASGSCVEVRFLVRAHLRGILCPSEACGIARALTPSTVASVLDALPDESRRDLLDLYRGRPPATYADPSPDETPDEQSVCVRIVQWCEANGPPTVFPEEFDGLIRVRVEGNAVRAWRPDLDRPATDDVRGS